MNIENITALADNPYVTMDTETKVEPTEPSVTEPVTQTEPVTETPPATDPVPPVTTPLDEIEIEGLGKVKVEDIKEWQKGNMRQADYTRKTQELAKQREEQQDALEVFNYLKQNPHLIAKLKEADNGVKPEIVDKASPQYDMVRDVWMNQRAEQLDKEVARLRGIYGEVDEVKLYNTATEMMIPVENIEVVYKALAFDNPKPVVNTAPTQPQVPDKDAIYAEVKAQILAELQQNRQQTGTIVSAPSAPITNPSDSIKLTEEERRVAKMMRMSDEEYAKWKE